jgi:PDZ domain-containing secreted protein
MEVYALFDNGKSEAISLEFLQPTSKGDRVDIIFLNDVPDNVMHSADNGIKEAFISLISHVNDLPEKISIWFKGFESDYCGNSTDLAFSMALYSQFVNEGYLRNSLDKDKIFATGVIDKKGNVKKITGLEGKVRAAFDVLSDDESGILCIPYDNRSELVEIMEKNRELNTAQNKKNMEILYVKSMKDLKCG